MADNENEKKSIKETLSGIFKKENGETKSIKEVVTDVAGNVSDSLEIGEEGKLSRNDIITLFMKRDDVYVDRAEFLKEALGEAFPAEVVEKAVAETPAAAGIKAAELEEICAKIIAEGKEATDERPIAEAIKKELAASKEGNGSGLKDLLKTAGDVKDALADNVLLREMMKTNQQLLYLYGAQEVEFNESGTIHGIKARYFLMLSFAVMSGVENATDALRAFVAAEPDLPDDILPSDIETDDIEAIMKRWGAAFISRQGMMTGAANSNFLAAKLLTKGSSEAFYDKYFTNLKNCLEDTVLSNPDHVPTAKETEIAERLRNIKKA